MQDRWAVIDGHIINGHVLQALALIRERFGDTIPESIDKFSERYEHLRKTCPDDFTKSREEYGQGFYS